MSASSIAEAIYDAICEEVPAEVCERIEVPRTVILPRRQRIPSTVTAATQRLPTLLRRPQSPSPHR